MHGKFRLQAAIVWRYPVFGCCFLSCVQCFCVSVIHQTLTWTTSSFTCIHSWGEAHQRVSTTFLTQKNSHIFLVLRTGFEPLVMEIHWISRPTLYQLSHHVPSVTVHFILIILITVPYHISHLHVQRVVQSWCPCSTLPSCFVWRFLFQQIIYTNKLNNRILYCTWRKCILQIQCNAMNLWTLQKTHQQCACCYPQSRRHLFVLN